MDLECKTEFTYARSEWRALWVVVFYGLGWLQHNHQCSTGQVNNHLEMHAGKLVSGHVQFADAAEQSLNQSNIIHFVVADDDDGTLQKKKTYAQIIIIAN